MSAFPFHSGSIITTTNITDRLRRNYFPGTRRVCWSTLLDRRGFNLRRDNNNFLQCSVYRSPPTQTFHLLLYVETQ